MRRTKRSVASRSDATIEGGWTPVEIDNEEPLTLLGAVCQTVDVVRGSQFDSRIFEVAARPIGYIVNLLSVNAQQAVVYAMVMEMYTDLHLSTFDLGRFLDISSLKAMMFCDDLDELCQRGYLARNMEDRSNEKRYYVTHEAIVALQQNRAISYANGTIDSVAKWFAELDKIVMARCQESIDYEMFCHKVDTLIKDGRKLHHIQRYMTKGRLLNVNDRMLFMWVCNMVVNDGFDSVVPENFKKLYRDPVISQAQRKSLSQGSNPLIANGLLCVATSSDQRSKDCYELSAWVMSDMLSELELTQSDVVAKDVLKHSSITPKTMFYNPKEQIAIDQLRSLLQPDRFTQVRGELLKQGFRSGFASLFYGSPGTGKTETVLQLARATGRDIMQVNISEIKSMWVGESEKNIKAVFTRYRKLVEESEVAPILLFNEADAIIGKRLESVMRSIDKTENTIQNILLEEIEHLDGILIATTNLHCNLDKAFERRFLYKVEFEKPSMEAKCAIWQSMIDGLNADDAMMLASKYDFSGGQIENVARKSVVDRILSGADLCVDTLCGHCDDELLDKSAVRNKIGY